MASGININIGHNRAEAGATQINNVTNHFGNVFDAEQTNRDCLRALQCPDPFQVKNQLKASKDVLLCESFEWILHDPHYLRWSDGQDVALLWIKGGAGKGKTMMSIGLVEELSRASQDGDSPVVIYFFCQNADSSLNNVDAIIKGLIHLLIRERPHIIQEVRARWDQTKGQFLTSTGRSSPLSQEDLWDIFLAMLDRCRHDRIFVLVDALDECRESIAQLLRQIVSTGLHQPRHVKWLLTSRHMDVAEDILLSRSNQTLVSLEVNLDHVAQSVAAYVSTKVTELSRTWRSYSHDLRQRIEQELINKAGATFLWVSLMCKELQQVNVEDALLTIERAPAGLQAVYERAYNELCTGDATDVAGCTQLLRVMMLAFRPLNLVEASNLLDVVADDQSLEPWIARSASFVQIQRQGGNIPYLVFTHQSARDYLAGLEESISGDPQISVNHTEMALRCVTYLTDNLTANPLQWPDHSAEQSEIVKNGAALPLGFAYSAEYWFRHLKAAPDRASDKAMLHDNGPVEIFLRRRLLEWLEFLTLTDNFGRAGEGLGFLCFELERINLLYDLSSCYAIVLDAIEILDSYRAVSCWPLQLYSSVLIFSPELSETKQLNLKRIPQWLRRIPEMKTDWSSLWKHYQSPSHAVVSIAFSPDGQLVASASNDSTVKLWKTQTGMLQHALQGHLGAVNMVGFSPDGQLLASGCKDNNVELWDTRTGRSRCTLRCRSSRVYVLAFSPDGQLLSSGGVGPFVELWETQTGRLRSTIRVHSLDIRMLTFSPDGQLIATGGWKTVELWETRTRRLHQTLQRDSGLVNLGAFSPDGRLIALGDKIDTDNKDVVKVWKVSQSSSIGAVFKGALRHLQKQQLFCTIEIDKYSERLRFSRDGNQLITDCGCYTISNNHLSQDPVARDGESNPLVAKSDWILCGSTRLFCIPWWCHVQCCDRYDDDIAIGTSNGELLIFSIDRKLAVSSMVSQSGREN